MDETDKSKTSEKTAIHNKTDGKPIFQTKHTFDSNNINQIILPSYPQVDGRSFRSQSYKLFDWLEYCPEKNVTYCFSCRYFCNKETKKEAFSITGFYNWKKALDKNKGFYKHQSSSSHRICVSKLEDKLKRVETKTEISTLLNENILEKHRYYVKSIIEIIQFLVVNELPLRGDIEMHEKKGYFNHFIDTLLKNILNFQNMIN